MANMTPAIEKLLITERGYADHPHDRGRETFCGISRRYWPEWPGWAFIDKWKANGQPTRELTESPFLMKQVEAFYQTQFWSALRLDELHDQRIAEEVFDSAVNCGHGNAVKWLQRALGVVGGVGHVDVDGKIGPQTVAAANGTRHKAAVLKAQNGLQFMHYYRLTEEDSTQLTFLRGWLRRVWEE